MRSGPTDTAGHDNGVAFDWWCLELDVERK